MSSDEGVGRLMHGVKIPLQDFALKMQGAGGLCTREGAFAGHYGTSSYDVSTFLFDLFLVLDFSLRVS